MADENTLRDVRFKHQMWKEFYLKGAEPTHEQLIEWVAGLVEEEYEHGHDKGWADGWHDHIKHIQDEANGQT